MDWSASLPPTHQGSDHGARHVNCSEFQCIHNLTEIQKIQLCEESEQLPGTVIVRPLQDIKAPWKKTCMKNELVKILPKADDISEIEITRGNSIILRTTSFECQSQLLEMKSFCGRNVASRISEDSITVKYVIHDVEIDISLQDIAEELECKGIEWSKIVRFTKPNGENKRPLPLIFVTEISNSIPEKMKMWYVQHRVTPYIEKPRMCSKCLKFGHTKTRCRGDFRCSKCGEEHEKKDCKSSKPFCFRCSDIHEATDCKCPVFIQETEILKIKSEKRLSYKDAKSLVTIAKKSYANVVSSKEDIVRFNKLQNAVEMLADKVNILTDIILAKVSESKQATNRDSLPKENDTTVASMCNHLICKTNAKVNESKQAANSDTLPKEKDTTAQLMNTSRLGQKTEEIPSTSKNIKTEKKYRGSFKNHDDKSDTSEEEDSCDEKYANETKNSNIDFMQESDHLTSKGKKSARKGKKRHLDTIPKNNKRK